MIRTDTNRVKCYKEASIKLTPHSALVALVLVLLPLGQREADACQCSDYDVPVCAVYWGATAVFTGLVTEVVPIPPVSAQGKSGEETVHFSVEQAFRGITSSTVEVISDGTDSSCYMGFQPGQRWLV